MTLRPRNATRLQLTLRAPWSNSEPTCLVSLGDIVGVNCVNTADELAPPSYEGVRELREKSVCYLVVYKEGKHRVHDYSQRLVAEAVKLGVPALLCKTMDDSNNTFFDPGHHFPRFGGMFLVTNERYEVMWHTICQCKDATCERNAEGDFQCRACIECWGCDGCTLHACVCGEALLAAPADLERFMRVDGPLFLASPAVLELAEHGVDHIESFQRLLPVDAIPSYVLQRTYYCGVCAPNYEQLYRNIAVDQWDAHVQSQEHLYWLSN